MYVDEWWQFIVCLKALYQSSTILLINALNEDDRDNKEAIQYPPQSLINKATAFRKTRFSKFKSVYMWRSKNEFVNYIRHSNV